MKGKSLCCVSRWVTQNDSYTFTWLHSSSIEEDDDDDDGSNQLSNCTTTRGAGSNSTTNKPSILMFAEHDTHSEIITIYITLLVALDDVITVYIRIRKCEIMAQIPLHTTTTAMDEYKGTTLKGWDERCRRYNRWPFELLPPLPEWYPKKRLH